ncbi:hypothetical protein [Streptomyces sp. NPDC054975]
MTSTTYTRDHVSTAVNAAVDLAADKADRDTTDTDNFIVNAALTLLENPDATFVDIVHECYDEDPDDVRSWL